MQRRHGGDRQQRKEQDFQALGTQADGASVILIEKRHHQILPFEQQNQNRDHTNDRELHDIFRRDGQNVAQHNGLNIHGGRIERHHKEPQPEKGRENQPNNSVFFQAAALVEKQHAGRRQSA
ncbi:hypothetical protein D3C80_1599460 [compost metagenome]